MFHQSVGRQIGRNCWNIGFAMEFVELNPDQRRETVNTQQRFQARQAASARRNAYRGSMVWSTSRGHDYLLRAGYDKSGRRRQVSLGPRSEKTENIKAEFERGRDEAEKRFAAIEAAMARQSAVNSALGLGRVPLLSARILRAIDASGLLGAGIRVLGTHAIYAYEAACGVRLDPGLTTTGDVDLLFDARKSLDFIAKEEFEESLSLAERSQR
ncbi:MAG: GSU2403 family nucleotidyltransferase fold protein [Roseiarcus sp.]